jgi:hypothetical protein
MMSFYAFVFGDRRNVSLRQPHAEALSASPEVTSIDLISDGLLLNK